MDDFTFKEHKEEGDGCGRKGNREMNIKQTCPKCGSTRTEAHEEDGYVVCFDCGYWTGESASWEQAVAIWNSQPLLDRALKAERERDEALAKLEDAKIANTVRIADADLYREAEVAKHEAKIAIEERDAALAEIDRIKENVRREAKAKTITLELPSEQNGHCFYITAPWSESEERLAKELSAVAELVTDLSKHIIDSEVVKYKEKLERALDYAKCAEACEEYEGPVRWRWKDMAELLETDK